MGGCPKRSPFGGGAFSEAEVGGELSVRKRVVHVHAKTAWTVFNREWPRQNWMTDGERSVHGGGGGEVRRHRAA